MLAEAAAKAPVLDSTYCKTCSAETEVTMPYTRVDAEPVSALPLRPALSSSPLPILNPCLPCLPPHRPASSSSLLPSATRLPGPMRPQPTTRWSPPRAPSRHALRQGKGYRVKGRRLCAVGLPIFNKCSNTSIQAIHLIVMKQAPYLCPLAATPSCSGLSCSNRLRPAKLLPLDRCGSYSTHCRSCPGGIAH